MKIKRMPWEDLDGQHGPAQAPIKFVPLDKPIGIHDMLVGPCSCGAWHDSKGNEQVLVPGLIGNQIAPQGVGIVTSVARHPSYGTTNGAS